MVKTYKGYVFVYCKNVKSMRILLACEESQAVTIDDARHYTFVVPEQVYESYYDFEPMELIYEWITGDI